MSSPGYCAPDESSGGAAVLEFPAGGIPARTPVLTVKNLTVGLTGSRGAPGNVLVDGVSFSVFHGEVLGLLGQSGSGKSLTSLAIAGLLPKTMYVSGSILFSPQSAPLSDGSPAQAPREIAGARERDLNGIRGSVSIVFQDPASALDPLMKIGRQIALPLKKHAGLSGRALSDAVFSLMEEVRLTDTDRIAASYPHEISGGQRQRAAIALALACSPALLIADEPTGSMDAQIQKQLVELIADVARRRGIAVLFISHDVAVVRYIAARIIVMKNGQIIEEASADDLIGNPVHEYTRSLINGVRTLERALKGDFRD